MKFSNILYAFIAFCGLGLLASCEVNNEFYDELDAAKKGTENAQNIELTLSADDYSSISKLGLKSATNESDTIKAKAIASLLSFSDDRPAADYLPVFLNDTYKNFDITSAVKVTYSYDTRDLDYLTAYTGAESFKLGEDEYAMVNELIASAQYFSPSYTAEEYLPSILNATYPDAVSGDAKLISYDYRDTDPNSNEYSEKTLFSADFTDLSQFSIVSVAGDQNWYASSYSGEGFAKISGYSGGTNYDNEDWLITPQIDLSDVSNPVLNINQALNYLKSGQQTFVYISDKYDATKEIDVSDWTELIIENKPVGTNWDFVASGDVDLSSFEGKKIQIAFVYKSPDVDAATWEISQVDITGLGQGAEGEIVEEYYKLEGSSWVKPEGVYYLQSADYTQMGSGPGAHGNFSSSVPAEDYLPVFLSMNKPYAQERDVMVMIYKYYSGGTKTIAAEYTYSEGVWSTMPEKTEQYVYTGSTLGWIFDPAVNYTMVAEDYQIIVDYVKNSVDAKYVDSYNTAESYYGSSAYHKEFAIADGKFDATEFKTWQDAVKAGVAAYLPIKYPNALAQVNGVDVNYIITFAGYVSSMVDYTITFKCTKSGPSPEFEYVEGPTLK